MAPLMKKPAPNFCGTAVIDGQFKTICLNDYIGKYLVLFFYPMDFSRVCPSEIRELSEQLEEFRRVGCEIVAVSCDSQFTHLAWIQRSKEEGGLGPIKIPLLADKSGKVTKEYGVYNDDEGIPNRALFIIDKNQVLRQIMVNDRPIARSSNEIMRLVQAIQFSDEQGKDETQTDVKRGIKRPVPSDELCDDKLKSKKTVTVTSNKVAVL